jgi:hypothetical protein
VKIPFHAANGRRRLSERSDDESSFAGKAHDVSASEDPRNGCLHFRTDDYQTVFPRKGNPLDQLIGWLNA